LQQEDARDVGQEVFKAVWRTIQTFRRDRPGDSFRGWLRTITRSKIAGYYRHKQADLAALGGSDALTLAEQVPETELPEPDPETDGSEKTLLYRRAVALIQTEFREKTWLAFEAIVLKGQSPAEAAKELHMSIGAIYSAKSRVLKRLYEEFEDLIET
jgi:RNA polymerase sigma-70 factor (ECF subfamily)